MTAIHIDIGGGLAKPGGQIHVRKRLGHGAKDSAVVAMHQGASVGDIGMDDNGNRYGTGERRAAGK